MGNTAVGTKKGAEKALKGYKSKGDAKTEAGQINVAALTGAPPKSIVYGVADIKAITMRKKKAATGYEYELVDPDNVQAMKDIGYEVVNSNTYPIRTLPSTVAAVAVAQSKMLNVKLTTDVTYEWSQSTETYTKVGTASRTRLGQIDGAATNQDEAVRRASGFIFTTQYAAFPPGTYIPLNGIKARYRYAPATPKTATSDGTSGIYTSFAADTAWSAV